MPHVHFHKVSHGLRATANYKAGSIRLIILLIKLYKRGPIKEQPHTSNLLLSLLFLLLLRSECLDYSNMCAGNHKCYLRHKTNLTNLSKKKKSFFVTTEPNLQLFIAELKRWVCKPVRLHHTTTIVRCTNIYCLTKAFFFPNHFFFERKSFRLKRGLQFCKCKEAQTYS